MFINQDVALYSQLSNSIYKKMVRGPYSFEVSMNDILSMKILEAISNVIYLGRAVLVRQTEVRNVKNTNEWLARSIRYPLQIINDITISHPGRHKADSFLSLQIENSIERHDIGMVKLAPENGFPGMSLTALGHVNKTGIVMRVG